MIFNLFAFLLGRYGELFDGTDSRRGGSFRRGSFGSNSRTLGHGGFSGGGGSSRKF
jgi:hypothetical protein